MRNPDDFKADDLDSQVEDYRELEFYKARRAIQALLDMNRFKHNITPEQEAQVKEMLGFDDEETIKNVRNGGLERRA